MISSPGWECRGASTPGAMVTTAWTTSRPAALRSCRCRSVRVTPGICASARPAPAIKTPPATSFATAPRILTNLLMETPLATPLPAWLVCGHGSEVAVRDPVAVRLHDRLGDLGSGQARRLDGDHEAPEEQAGCQPRPDRGATGHSSRKASMRSSVDSSNAGGGGGA